MSGAFAPQPAGTLSLETDVLVIGGSLSGAWAALAARRKGARVVVAEKGHVGTSGAVAAANSGGNTTVPGDPEASDRAVKAWHHLAGGLDDLAFIRTVYDEAWRVGARLQEMGFVSSRGTPPPERRMTNFRGPYALRFLREQLIRAGVTVLDHSPALELLTNGSRVAGAAGVNRQTGVEWRVRAGAVILATGGNAFRSGAIGTMGQTGDGHLMGAEAGARLAGMEFSGHYGIVPLGSSISKGFWYSSATFRDGNGKELARNGWSAVPDVAQAILETGSAWAQIDRGPPGFEESSRRMAPNLYLSLDRMGIDPIRQRFQVDLLYEGTVRASGGLIVDGRASTGVPGLYASGDLTEKIGITGSFMSGGGPAVSWCLASGEWSGTSAAEYALGEGPPPGTLSGLGRVGLRPRRPGHRPEAADTATARAAAAARGELLPLAKNAFRTADGLRASLSVLDRAWEEASDGLAGESPRERVAAREAASMLQGARWICRSAEVRTETRGLHRRRDYPAADGAQLDRVETEGLDDIRVVRRPLARA